MSHPLTNRMWVTLLYFFARQSPHPMTDRMWVSLPYFFAWQSHQSCLIPWQNRMWVILLDFFARQPSSHDQQGVSNTTLFNFPPPHHPMITDCKFYEIFYQVVSLLLILWPIVSEWHVVFARYFKFSSYYIQVVSENTFDFHQKISPDPMTTNRKCVVWLLMAHIISYCMSNRKWVELHFMSSAVH